MKKRKFLKFIMKSINYIMAVICFCSIMTLDSPSEIPTKLALISVLWLVGAVCINNLKEANQRGQA